MNMHKVPVHLDTQDTFLWQLTFRQVLVLFVGGGMTYMVITTNWSTPLATLLCVLFGSVCGVVTLLIAFLRIAHRDLEQWFLVALLFYGSSRLSTWEALEEQDIKQIPQKRDITEKEQEAW